jgi:hypothetical protein
MNRAQMNNVSARTAASVKTFGLSTRRCFSSAWQRFVRDIQVNPTEYKCRKVKTLGFPEKNPSA